jgi:hypothetical protein
MAVAVDERKLKTKEDYETLDWHELRALAKKRGISTAKVTRPRLTKLLLKQDDTGEVPQLVRIQQYTRDACKIIDQYGRLVCMCYRTGRGRDYQSAEEMPEMDMMGNAEIIADALNRNA